MKRILIIEAEMKRYRAPFYRDLYAALRSQGIALRVAYSDPRATDISKGDHCELPDEYGMKVKGYWLVNRLLLQPLVRHAAAADLIISSEGSRLLFSQLLLPFAACKLKKLALWGFGQNKQADRQPFSEWYKRKVLRYPSWWFAYTAGSAEYLMARGYPRERITTVQNAVDTGQISRWIAGLSADETASLRAQLHVPPASPVGIYCGSLEKCKNLPFLIESAKLVKRQIPDFHLVLVGGGSESVYVERQVQSHREWIHWTGPKFGAEKAALLKAADIFMLPGKIGLAILDSFAARLPILTTRIPNHCPEVEYLTDGCNGMMTENSVDSYARGVVEILSDAARLAALKQGAYQSSLKYSMETMVANFCRGIEECLSRN